MNCWQNRLHKKKRRFYIWKMKWFVQIKERLNCVLTQKIQQNSTKTQQFWMKYWATRTPRTIKEVLAIKEWVTDSAIEMKLSFQDTKMQIKRNSMYLQNKLNSCMTILSVTKNEFHIVKCFRCNNDGHVAKYFHIIICDITIDLDIRIKIVQRK